tara:strand:- start:80 stop:1012 length:933 start_codon:yes stop_codon:yes gene_type:complete
MRLTIKEKIEQYEQSFEKISNLIQDDDIENEVRVYLKGLINIINYNKEIIPVRVILSAYLIHYCHSEVLSTEKDPTESLLHIRSSELVSKLSNPINDKLGSLCMIQSLSLYNNLFRDWKKKDVESQLNIYLDLYDNYKKMNNVILSTMVYSAIKYLAKENTDSIIEEYRRNNETQSISNSLENAVVRNMKEAYWNSVELTEEQYCIWIDDIFNYFVRIYDRITKDIEKNDFYANFDPVYLKEQLHLNQFETKKTFMWLLWKIVQVDCIYQDKENKNMRNLLELDNEELNDTLIKKTVRYILERLEYISNF